MLGDMGNTGNALENLGGVREEEIGKEGDSFLQEALQLKSKCCSMGNFSQKLVQ